MVRLQLDERQWQKLEVALAAEKRRGRPGRDDVLRNRGWVPVIASNGSRACQVPYDKELYKARSEIECTFNLLKQARRFATRYEKTLRNYSAVVALGCALLWLRI